MALSTAEAEYVAAAICCAQLHLIKQQLKDFEVLATKILLMCDNMSALNMAKKSGATQKNQGHWCEASLFVG